MGIFRSSGDENKENAQSEGGSGEEVNNDVYEWHKRMLYEISPREFEELVAETFEKEGGLLNWGRRVEVTQKGKDGGIDAYMEPSLVRGVFGAKEKIVQVKQRSPNSQNVGIGRIDRMAGVSQRLDEDYDIVYITNKYYTEKAREAAEDFSVNFHLMDGDDVVDRVNKVGICPSEWIEV